MSVLRHADIKTTLRYAHMLDEDIRCAMEAVDGKKTASQNRISLSAPQFDHFVDVNKMVFWRLTCV